MELPAAESTDDKSTLVQAMTFGCEATSHYLSQSVFTQILSHMASLGQIELKASLQFILMS